MNCVYSHGIVLNCEPGYSKSKWRECVAITVPDEHKYVKEEEMCNHLNELKSVALIYFYAKQCNFDFCLFLRSYYKSRPPYLETIYP